MRALSWAWLVTLATSLAWPVSCHTAIWIDAASSPGLAAEARSELACAISQPASRYAGVVRDGLSSELVRSTS